MVLAAVLGGCPGPLLAPHLVQIADALVEPDVCQEYQQVSKQSLRASGDERPAAGVKPTLAPGGSSVASSEGFSARKTPENLQSLF